MHPYDAQIPASLPSARVLHTQTPEQVNAMRDNEGRCQEDDIPAPSWQHLPLDSRRKVPYSWP